jgi:Stress responsive A/B Barrel Domain
MIYHIVRMSFKPDVPPEVREAGIERLRRYHEEIDVIQSWSVGRDIGGEFEIGAMYALADIEAYETYMNAPWHLETDAAGLPLVSNFVSFDLTDDEDPEIADKIAEVHRRRFENHPETLALVEGLDSYTGSGVPDDSSATPS